MLALVLREPHAETVNGLLDRWENDDVELHAPLLAQYEVASGLTRRRARGEFSGEDVDATLWTLDGPLARNAGDRYPVTLVE
jgi:predicted nucleic acid-binding protein